MTGEDIHGLSGWGLVYCYGNRLEVLRPAKDSTGRIDPHRVGRPDSGDVDKQKVIEVKTDMAVLYVPDVPAHIVASHVSSQQSDTDKSGSDKVTGRQSEQTPDRLVTQSSAHPPGSQPFYRRERQSSWAFCHSGAIRQPANLDPGERIPDSRNASERYFLHLLKTFDADDPVGSVTGALSRLADEPELTFVLLSTETLVAARWHLASTGPSLWYGTGQLVRMVSSVPLQLSTIAWEEVANRSVLAVNRTRRITG